MAGVGISLSASAQFIHPGCLHTQEDLDRINEQIEAGHPHVTKAWKSFNDNWLLSNGGSWFGSLHDVWLKRGIAGDENFAHSERDFGMCYIKSIYWALKRNSDNADERAKAELYAQQATRLLNKYAKTIIGIGGNSNYALIGAFQGWQVANAAELLSTYPGWSEDDQAFFKQWVYDVWYGCIKGFLYGQNGTCASHYHSNWGIGNVNGMQAIGVYLDDPFIYNEAMYYLKWSDQNCSLKEGLCGSGLGMLPWGFNTDELNEELEKKGIDARYHSPLGMLYQNQESNRDQPHAILAMGMLMQTLEQTWKQGDNAYAWNNSVAAGGLEYIAGFLSAGTTPEDSVFMKNYPNKIWDGCEPFDYMIGMSYAGRKNREVAYQRGINHYARRMGLNMPYAKRAHQEICNSWNGGVEWGAGANTRFSYSDLAGYGDLMQTEDSLTAAPTILRGQITMVSGSSLSQLIGWYRNDVKEYTKALNEGDAIFSNELSNIISGSTVKLSPTIMDGTEDTGQWTWDDDPLCTTREREVTLITSRILRARYTNEEGAVSTQMFSLHVEGEGWVGTHEPYYKMDGTTGSDSVIYVKKFNDLTIGFKYNSTGASVREWKWEKRSLTGTKWNSFTNNSNYLDIAGVSVGSYYRVTMITRAGVKVSQEFRVEVAEVDPYIISNNNTPFEGAGVVAERGSSISLYGVPNSVLAKSLNTTRIYNWIMDGDTVQSNTLTFHLDNSGKQVADLSDTLHIEALDTCLNVTMAFNRIASTGGESETVFNFSIPVYEKNNLQATTDDSFYIIDPVTDKYLNNTDATFTNYDEENDDAFLWRLRQMNASYGNRYMIISRVNSNAHLTEMGKLSTSGDYSKHSFTLLHKYSDENLYALQRSAAAGGGLLDINQNLSELTTSEDPCREFPFKIVNVKEDIEDPDGVEVIEEREMSVITYAKHGCELVLQAQEAGVLQMYSIYGTLLQTTSCVEGINQVVLEKEYWGVAVCRYVSTSGKQKSFKVMFTPDDF